jgi:hypothetical protein
MKRQWNHRFNRFCHQNELAERTSGAKSFGGVLFQTLEYPTDHNGRRSIGFIVNDY